MQEIRPGDPDYDDARALWNAMHDRRPALIVRPRTAAEVAAAVRHARDEGLVVAVRGGGHSMPGHSVCDDGMVIDLRLLNAVHVGPIVRRATVGGGALLGELDRATQAHGLVVPAGVVSHTGVGGLTLGGGVGRLMRRFGLTIDSLLSAEVVTADGDILRASQDEHPDLFWALRGGGAGFGIVTEFEFALHELSELVILATFHPLDEARAVIERARRHDGPDELLWTSFLRRANDVPWMPRELVGTRGIMSLIEWSGDVDAAPLEAIRAELAPAASDLAVMPFLTMQTITDDLFAHGLRTYIKAGFADDLPVDVLLERAALVESPISQIELLQLGGAIARVPNDATAFAHRDARWLINIPATWRDPADDAREIAWARGTYAALKPHLRTGQYLNFMDADDALENAYGDALPRLQQVKANLKGPVPFNFAAHPPAAPRGTTNIKGTVPFRYVQRRLWGTDPRAWAELAEPHNRPLFEAVLDAAGVGEDSVLLDVGCGSGLALALARVRGARVSGIDITPGLLAIARERLPDADLREGDMEALPFADDAFDAVIGVNAFQFAADPVRALREAARVSRGPVVVSLFAAPERSDGTALHEAMAALIPPERAADHAPYALSERLEETLRAAGLAPAEHGEVQCTWVYRDIEEGVRALLCSAGGARAKEAAGEAAVRAALEPVLARFQNGEVRLVNTFRWVAAR